MTTSSRRRGADRSSRAVELLQRILRESAGLSAYGDYLEQRPAARYLIGFLKLL